MYVIKGAGIIVRPDPMLEKLCSLVIEETSQHGAGARTLQNMGTCKRRNFHSPIREWRVRRIVAGDVSDSKAALGKTVSGRQGYARRSAAPGGNIVYDHNPRY